MPRKRFLGASLALHVGLFAAIAVAGDLHLHGRTLVAPARPLPSRPIQLVDVPEAAPKHEVEVQSAIAYPRTVTPTPRPTPKPTPHPTPHPAKPKAAHRAPKPVHKHPKPAPKPTPTPTPRPSPKASPKPADYRKQLPALAQRSSSDADLMARRLTQLGLDPTAAASMDHAVQAAIEAGSGRFYHPTTPGTPAGNQATASAAPEQGAFVLPSAWAAPSSPLQSFLDRVLPPDKGYDADLTFDAAGMPQLRIRYRHGDLATGRDLVFVEHWDPAAPGTPSVGVAVLRPDGSPAGHFAFPMVAPPAGNRDTFIDAMAGASMLAYLQSGTH